MSVVFLGAPYLAIWVIIREVKEGNLGALRELTGGILDFYRSSSLAGE
jgi:phenylpyruvate tautomerase PptA (4-oxalocrotonate tautomerase family)